MGIGLRIGLKSSVALLANLAVAGAVVAANEVANQAINSPTPPVASESRAPAGTCDTAALRCIGRLLVYDNNTKFQPAMRALDWCAIPYTRAIAGDFVTLLNGGGWDVVIMDMPSSEPADTTWTTALATYITAGGRAIHTHWSSMSLTAELQGAYEITAGASHDTLTFYEWSGTHQLFTSPNPISNVFDVWIDEWGNNGFRLTPVGSAVSAAGFTAAPALGQAAIVIGNSGRTIFNGFLFDDFQSADKDADLDSDMVELIVNELASFCASTTCGDRNVDPGEDCDSGGVDTSLCDSDCTFPSCGDRHWNVPVGEACDQGGDTATCDADCTLPSCGDRYANAAAGEDCDEGGVDTAACDSDCTRPSCGDRHWNVPAGEECDEGGIDTAACDADCTLAICGDGYWNVPAGEACDDGGIDTAKCDADCTIPTCGDRYVNVAAGEACDGGGVDTAGCDADCTIPTCGDRYVNAAAGEACDNGGVDSASCDADCTVPICGDGYANAAAGEECDGGSVDTATCDADCTRPVCGDNHTNGPAGETCDDGGTTPGDGCDATCQVEGCLVGSLSPIRLLKGAKEGTGARFSWAAGAVPAIAHVNRVATKREIPTSWRATRGTGGAVCDAPAATLNCLDTAPPPVVSTIDFLQVVAACGGGGSNEGPI